MKTFHRAPFIPTLCIMKKMSKAQDTHTNHSFFSSHKIRSSKIEHHHEAQLVVCSFSCSRLRCNCREGELVIYTLVSSWSPCPTRCSLKPIHQATNILHNVNTAWNFNPGKSWVGGRDHISHGAQGCSSSSGEAGSCWHGEVVRPLSTWPYLIVASASK
jgi:hypothetical protein